MLKINNFKKGVAAAVAALTLITVPALSGSTASALSSSAVQDAGKTYFEADYDYLDDEASVYQSVTYEEAVYLFEQEGNFMFLFGGSWCANTTAAIDYINDAAEAAGVDTIYNLDFRMDGRDENTHIRESDGSSQAGSHYNYLYGELVSKYLTNLDDWVEYTSVRTTALTYTNADGEEVTVAKVQVPFLFIYNKDNKVNNSRVKHNADTYPIVYGFEEMVYRGKGTKNLYNGEGELVTDEYVEDLDKAIFSHIGDGEGQITLSEFTDADYIRLSYNAKAGEKIFADDEKINIRTLTYRQLSWLLEQEGQYLLLFGGSWSVDTRAIIKAVNTYAVQNGLLVYNFDYKLDGGYAKQYLDYTKDLNILSDESEFAELYAEILAELKVQNAPQFFYYDKDAENPVAAQTDSESRVSEVIKAYAERVGIETDDPEGDNGYISRIVAGVLGVAVAVAALVWGLLKKNKQPTKAKAHPPEVQAFDANDGCGGCEAELPEQTEQRQESVSSFDVSDGGCCGGFDDDDEGGCC